MLVVDIDRAREVPGSEPQREIAEPGGTTAIPSPPPQMPRPRLERQDWQPLAGASILERLRVTGRRRLKADPELVGRLRAGLERGLLERGLGIDIRAGLPGRHGDAPRSGVDADLLGRRSAPVVVTKDRLTRVLACEAHHVANEFGERPLTPAIACGALIDALFRQLVTVGSINDPMTDGLAALGVDDNQRELVSWIERMPGPDRQELRSEVERQTDGLVRRWPPLEPSWLPRTQEAMRVALLDGAVELSARVDLAVGRPPGDDASVALVEIKAGVRRVEHRADLHFYALVEALRSQAPPFVVATYYTRTGELDVDPVTEELLTSAVRRTVVGAHSLWNLASGAEPRRMPNGLCGRCVLLPECEVGQTRVEQSADAGPGPWEQL